MKVKYLLCTLFIAYCSQLIVYCSGAFCILPGKNWIQTD